MFSAKSLLYFGRTEFPTRKTNKKHPEKMKVKPERIISSLLQVSQVNKR